MTANRFQDLEIVEVTPKEWLERWSAKYPADDDQQYNELIARHRSFSAEDFELIGKWKDDALTKPGRWKENVASSAYLIWMDAATELPNCPESNGIEQFLSTWTNRDYVDTYQSGQKRNKHFGLSRATTLLHFLSGGKYPILDSRVRTAFELLSNIKAEDTAQWYVDRFYPYFQELAATCDTQDDLRKLDKALFSYGSSTDALALKSIWHAPQTESATRSPKIVTK